MDHMHERACDKVADVQALGGLELSHSAIHIHTFTYLEGSAHGLEALCQGVPVVQKCAAHDFASAGTPRELDGGDAVSYTHLTLPTICSV